MTAVRLPAPDRGGILLPTRRRQARRPGLSMLPDLPAHRPVVPSSDATLAFVRRYLPVILGVCAATLLFVFVRFNVLNTLSANTDHPTIGYDFFGFPRCGLAVRYGTNPFTADHDYP